MICSPCTATKLLPDCLETLVIGEVGAATTDYLVYIKDVTTGRINRYEGTSDGSSILSIELDQRLAVNHSYELWVTLADAASQEDKESVIIDGDTDPHDCFSLRFETTYTDGDKNSFEEVTLTAA